MQQCTFLHVKITKFIVRLKCAFMSKPLPLGAWQTSKDVRLNPTSGVKIKIKIQYLEGEDTTKWFVLYYIFFDYDRQLHNLADESLLIFTSQLNGFEENRKEIHKGIEILEKRKKKTHFVIRYIYNQIQKNKYTFERVLWLRKITKLR